MLSTVVVRSKVYWATDKSYLVQTRKSYVGSVPDGFLRLQVDLHLGRTLNKLWHSDRSLNMFPANFIKEEVNQKKANFYLN